MIYIADKDAARFSKEFSKIYYRHLSELLWLRKFLREEENNMYHRVKPIFL